MPPLDALVPRIFDQAQATSANHQKNFVALYRLHADAAAVTEPFEMSLVLTGEHAFQNVFIAMLARVLPLKKGTAVADRIVKFVGGYTKFINEKATEQRAKDGLDDDEDSVFSRFISRVLRYVLGGCVAKDKVVRFRVVQAIAEMIAHLGEIDEDLYASLRSSLMQRVRDKEPAIRVQAIAALSKLAGSEDVSELDDEQSIMDALLDALAHDTAADVRRAALANTPLTAQTLPAILARTRDTDPVVRRLVYSHVLEPHCVNESPARIGFTHPRALTIAQRELLVRNGLGDREDAVRAAAAKLLATWVDVVRVEEGAPKGGVHEDLVAFLKLFDLVEGKIAEDALLSIFKTRLDIFDGVEFGDDYWVSLTPETAFLARVFVEHCIAVKDSARLEATLPVVTALAFRIQSAYNDLLRHMQDDDDDRLFRDDDDDARAHKEEQRLDREFVIGEMLKLAVNLDYADEIGRRKMFQLVRDMISHDVLPESLLAHCLDVLRILSPNERDLIRVVVEVVHELRDPSEPEEEMKEVNDGETEYGKTPVTVRTIRTLPKPESEMSPEEKIRADAIDVRCLSLCIGMLERVNGTFEENSTLEGILGELIIPSVKRKELLLRQKGLVCLGLCCLIARRMALKSFQLFLGQIQAAPEVLKISVLQIVFDILMVHEGDFLGAESANGERIVNFLLHLLENEEAEKVQALLCIGISKLMLSGMITDDRLLRGLVLVYISPETSSNQELRQCLSYFFPVYCYSSPVNQRRMQKIFVPLYEHLTNIFQEWDEDQEPITPAHVAMMFVDWTDPQKAAAVTKVARTAEDDAIHLDLAADIIRALFSHEMDQSDKKPLVQLLSKLYIPDKVDDDKIRTLKLLTHSLRSRRLLRDSTSQNAVSKFDDSITKSFGAQLESFSEEEYRQLESMKDLFVFLDEHPPESDEEDVKPAKRARKRRSESVATTTSGTSDQEIIPPSPGRKRGNAKRRRVSQTDESSDEDAVVDSRPPAASTRVMPKRSAAVKSRNAVSAALKRGGKRAVSDSEEEDEEEEESDEDVKPKKSSRTRSSEEEQPPPPSPDEDEEEAEEVDDLL
ncbi:hypothetical protein WOLCODRAFT_110578 [Wolfiporia cocos MD-104 SS10]|uniref:Nuclear condensin complex subunit 3 C-terminal domain-containing protein n=1 Tax=Wolfiporia cocos (strain MD-104) TaxID=742152 RepID=A0A2H3JB58_WOLCO|nr:hypothetical protein WOLCODRAFT_110578 [Wolfiporia cocos MD-104 SS10]